MNSQATKQLRWQPVLRIGLLIGAIFGVATTTAFTQDQPVTEKRNRLDWWSLKPLAKPELPLILGEKTWAENPVDRFIYAKLNEKGLTPSPPADRKALIRRATYDLLGMPPTPEEIEAFENDEDPDAYGKLIDRLLASPRYGERWGRHWLDVVRFGESRGFERNEIINTAWPFRDYVIRSLNDDKPIDQLIIEHLAGDVVASGNPLAEVGTTFLVAGPYDDVGNQDAVQARIIRANTIDEIITAASSAFLGLTVNCARCHDHKFDPITAEDYYRLYSIFSGVVHGERIIASNEQKHHRETLIRPLEQQRSLIQKSISDLESEALERFKNSNPKPIAYSLSAVDPHLTEDRFPPTQAKWIRLSLRSNNRDPRSAGGIRIDEFEVWTAEPTARNVAAASAGGKAKAPSRRAEDFAEAYAPSLVNDGEYGARWIVDGPAQLMIELAQVEQIDRITFSADRQKALPPTSGEIVFAGEYGIEVSLDGKMWTKVADSLARPPLTDQFARERLLQQALTEKDHQKRTALQKDLDAVNIQIRKIPPLPSVWAGRFDQPKEVAYVMKGGDPTRKGDEVRPASLSALDQITPSFQLAKDAPEQERRLALAKWLVNKDNPLPPRVMANRIWHYHFGIGIVDTPSDFGALGGLPTHPELLDWLALRLQELGWRLKPLHRELMLSQTYQQSAAWRADAAKIDADSRFVWRFPPRRLSAEEIRDTMLSIAGVLNERMGGPGFKLYRYLQDNVATYIPLESHGSETYRRAVYHHNARSSRIDLITEFDGPDCAFATPRRAATTSPLQALTLLNHQFTVDITKALSNRLQRDSTNLVDQIHGAFRLILGRAPTETEMNGAKDLILNHGLPAFSRALLNSNEMIYLE